MPVIVIEGKRGLMSVEEPAPLSWWEWIWSWFEA